jgi:tetratricopeptide (TPR) repeat protein
MRIGLAALISSVCFPSLGVAGDPIAAEGFHKQIDALVIEKRLDEAEKLALEAYRQHPEAPEIICALGCVYRNKAMRGELQIDTDAMGIKEGEGGHLELKQENLKQFFHERTTYDRELYAKAEERYYEAIRKAPDYTNPYFNLLNDYVTLSEFDKYFEVIGRMVSNLKSEPKTRRYLLDLAGDLVRNEDVDIQHALRLYRIILGAYPDYVDAKADYGAALLADGDLETALSVLKEAYDANPADPLNAVNYHRGLVLNEDFAAAWPLVAKLPHDRPNRPFADALLALVTGHDPKPLLAAGAVGPATGDEPKDFWTRAGEDLLALPTFAPDRRRSLLEEQAGLCAQHGYDVEAILAAQLLQREAPEAGGRALVILAAVYDRKNILSKTVQYLDRIAAARQQDPSLMSEADLFYNYGRIHFRAGQDAVALGHLERSFALDQRNPALNHVLGLCHLRLGDKDKAREIFALNAKLDDKEQIRVINASIRMLRSLDSKEGRSRTSFPEKKP